MSLLTTLPVLDGARVIVINEEADVKHAESLITAWLPIWGGKDSRRIILLCFSRPPSSSKIYINSLKQHQVEVHDFYTVDASKIDPYENVKLWELPEIASLVQDSTVIIDSLSTLILYKGVAETCRFVEKLSTKVTQLICIYQRDFMREKIPSIETMGTSYVRLEPILGVTLDYNLSYKTLTSHRKPGGAILQQVEIVKQNISSYEIETERISNIHAQKSRGVIKSEAVDKIQASFRIEINDREMEQRNATPLPYTLPTLTSSESKIHYQPDEIDDLDEEDPDDDLDF